MTDFTVACVRIGTKYGIEYVERLRSMVSRHLDGHGVDFICLTDQPEKAQGVDMIDISGLGLTGWWAKMAVLAPHIRGMNHTLYLDLDTVIVDELWPLERWRGPFAICQNFTKLAGHPDWPCNYGSCVMSIPPGFGEAAFTLFMQDPQGWIERCPKGDQQAIEMLIPGALYLQDLMPPGYFVGRRDFTDEKPPGAAVMIFAGKHKPHNTPHQWLREAWC